MNDKHLSRAAGWLLMFVAVAIIASRRILGIDLTEGQLLISDWPWFVVAVVVALIGARLAAK